MVRLGAKPEHAPGIFPMHKNRLSAEVIERMLQADGHSPEIIYHKTFRTKRYDIDSMQVISLVGGLAGFGERIAERPEIGHRRPSRQLRRQASPGGGDTRQIGHSGRPVPR